MSYEEQHHESEVVHSLQRELAMADERVAELVAAIKGLFAAHLKDHWPEAVDAADKAISKAEGQVLG